MQFTRGPLISALVLATLTVPHISIASREEMESDRGYQLQSALGTVSLYSFLSTQFQYPPSADAGAESSSARAFLLSPNQADPGYSLCRRVQEPENLPKKSYTSVDGDICIQVSNDRATWLLLLLTMPDITTIDKESESGM
jgi:hypothetical protein